MNEPKQTLGPRSDTIWDPLRRKNVALTPEERVRQWFIGVLTTDFKVPVHMMMSELSMKFGNKPWRADIVVYDRAQKPMAVVECKRPDVALTQAVLDQAVRYNLVLDVRYIIITNGHSTYALLLDPAGASPSATCSSDSIAPRDSVDSSSLIDSRRATDSAASSSSIDSRLPTDSAASSSLINSRLATDTTESSSLIDSRLATDSAASSSLIDSRLATDSAASSEIAAGVPDHHQESPQVVFLDHIPTYDEMLTQR